MSKDTVYLLDTNIISDMMRNPRGAAARMAAARARQNAACRMVTSVIVHCEVLFGIRRRTSLKWQQQYDAAMEGMEILPLTLEIPSIYASLRGQLEAQGTPIGPNDTLIAAHALALGATLVTADAEFTRVPGLQVENWLQA
jgi:tRNA(fMet)-specific endonuclease VapC